MGLFDIFKKKAKEVSEPTSSYTSDVGVNSSKRSTKNASKEFEKYLTLAEQGDAKIQLNLALCYIFGHGTAVDNVKASKWILKAAEQGDAKACFFAGRVYFYGAGVPQDYQESLKWYRKAADKGVLRAQHFLQIRGRRATELFRSCKMVQKGSRKWICILSESVRQLL